MNHKKNGIAVIVSSVILGSSIFGASMVSEGLILQKELIQPKENILTTTVGHVNLGKVYSESRGMDIILSDESDKSPAAIDIINVDPNDFSDKLHSALAKIAKEINESQNLSGEKAIKPENLSGKIPFNLNIKTYINYRSENMPMYTLMIKDERVTINKNEKFETRITNEAERIAKSSTLAFSLNSFISEPEKIKY